MQVKGKRVFVTGADGFIGSHLVESLVRQGATVRALAYYNATNSYGWLDSLDPQTLSAIEIITGDIRDYHAMHEAMQGCQIVFHLAALIGIPFSYRSPDLYIDTNVKGTLNILQAARTLNTERVIHTSTSEVYGTAQFVPITEEHPLHPQSPYAASKVGADQLALSFFCSFETPVCVARPFNTFGPRQSARAVIPTIISQLKTSAGKIKLGSLSPTRDFSYVDDTVAGFIALAESDKCLGKVINLGSNFEISIADTVALIGEITGITPILEDDEQRHRPPQSEVHRLWADTRKAHELSNWTPRFAGAEGFQRGLERTVEWFSDPSNLARYKSQTYNV